MEIRLADSGNFTETSLDGFDRYQEVRNVYRLAGGELKLQYRPFTETWSVQRRREKAAEILSGEYVTFCAFDGERVAGEIMLVPELHGGRMIIESLHVSREYRRCGIGRALFDAAKCEARRRGATALYLSACSAQETVGFYLAMGCRVSPDPIASYAAAEPCDIQLECGL